VGALARGCVATFPKAPLPTSVSSSKSSRLTRPPILVGFLARNMVVVVVIHGRSLDRPDNPHPQRLLTTGHALAPHRCLSHGHAYAPTPTPTRAREPTTPQH